MQPHLKCFTASWGLKLLDWTGQRSLESGLIRSQDNGAKRTFFMVLPISQYQGSNLQKTEKFKKADRTWRLPRSPSVGKWINKLWSIQMMGYYSMTKRSELCSHEKTCRKLKCILLRERRPSEKARDCTIPTM